MSAEHTKLIEELQEYSGELTNARLTRFNRNESFVLKENQWTDQDLEDQKIKSDQQELTVNQTGDFISEFYLAKLFPRDPKTNTVSIGANVKDIQDEEKAKKYEKSILDTYRDNQFIRILLEQGLNFLVGGNGGIYHPFDTKAQLTRIFSIDPRTVYYKFDGFELQEFMFVEGLLLNDKDGFRSLWTGLKDSLLGTKEFKDKKITYWNKQRMFEMTDGVITKEERNERGKIPFQWLENMPNAHQHEGTPEVRDSIKSLQKEYNKILTSFARRVQKNTSGKFAFKTKRELEEVSKESEEREYYRLDPEDSIDSVEFKENKEILEYAEMIDRLLKRSKGMNSATDGDIKTHVSGIAMQFAFAPLMDKIGLRRIPFDTAIREINEHIIYYEHKEENQRVEPVYSPIVVQDYNDIVTNIVKMRELETPIISLDLALDTLHGTNISSIEKAKIEEELKKIDEKKMKEAEIQSKNQLGVKGDTPPLPNKKQ